FLPFSHFFFLNGGCFRPDAPHPLPPPQGRSRPSKTLQQPLPHARRGHFFFFPHPLNSRRSRKFLDSPDDRREGLGFPENQSPELVHLHRRRLLRPLFLRDGRFGHWLDVLHAAQQRLFEFRRHSRSTRNFHQWILFDSHRAQLHR